MITASKMREITKKYYNSPNLRARANRIRLEYQIKKQLQKAIILLKCLICMMLILNIFVRGALK